MTELSFYEEFRLWKLLKEKGTPPGELPVVSTSFTRGIFRLNNPAMSILDIQTGGHLLLVDMGEKAAGPSHRFFLTKGYEYNGRMLGKRISVYQTFLDTRAYMSMYTDIILPGKINYDEFVNAGIGEYYLDASRVKRFRPFNRVEANLVPYSYRSENDELLEQFSLLEGMPRQSCFRLFNFRKIEPKPRDPG